MAGPSFRGPCSPSVFVTIACGAISGFNALISSGTTPKMVDKESDIRPIGYGAMLIEGLVGVMALIAATAMAPGDYFAINVSPAIYEKLTFEGVQLQHVDIARIEAGVGETVEGRTGGAVSLAVGMAQIFSQLPGMQGLLAYWYHFAIMFEALFILTTIDSGTRVGRFILQEFLGKAYKPFARPDWMPGALIATAAIVLPWAYFIYTGQIDTIWPMFGVANQLLTSALLKWASILSNTGRSRSLRRANGRSQAFPGGRARVLRGVVQPSSPVLRDGSTNPGSGSLVLVFGLRPQTRRTRRGRRTRRSPPTSRQRTASPSTAVLAQNNRQNEYA